MRNQKGSRLPTGEENRRKVMDAIREYIDAHGYPPTVRELCSMTGIRSTSNVSWHLEVLARDGLIERTPGVSRGIRIAGDVLY